MTDKQLQSLTKLVMTYGRDIETRNSLVKRLITQTCSFHETPLVTVRKTAWKNALREMEWFLSGSSNIKDLDKRVHKWWKPWANLLGDVSYNYSKQFRRFGSHNIDQIQYLLNGIKNHPYSRRNVITTWDTSEMALSDTPITNCHGTVIQAFVSPDNQLTLVTYQRSADLLLGIPHNWIQYWAMLLWIARETDTRAFCLDWIGGDVHIYDQHYVAAKEIIDANIDHTNRPQLIINPTKGPFRAEDFTMVGDIPDPQVTTKLEMVV